MGSYLFNKIAARLHIGLDTASEPDTGSHGHVSVHGGEYLGERVHQADLDAIGMSIGILFKFAASK